MFSNLPKIFNRYNFSRAIIVFLVGFVSRFLVNFFFDIDVFHQFTHITSLTYYSIFALFCVHVNEIQTYIANIFLKLIGFIFKKIFNFELKEFIYNIADTINAMKNNDKIIVGRNLNSNSSDNSNIDFTYDGMKKNDKITVVTDLNNNSSDNSNIDYTYDGMKNNDKIIIVTDLNNNSSDNSNIDDTNDGMKNYDKLAIGSNGLAIRDNDSNIWNGKDRNIMKMDKGDSGSNSNSSNNSNLERNENPNPQPQQSDLSGYSSENSDVTEETKEFYSKIERRYLEGGDRHDNIEKDMNKQYA